MEDRGYARGRPDQDCHRLSQRELFKARLSCTFVQMYVRENPNHGWDGLLIIE